MYLAAHVAERLINVLTVGEHRRRRRRRRYSADFPKFPAKPLAIK